MTTKAIKSIATTAIFAWTIAGFGAAMATESVKITVNGMVCAFCAQGIEKRLSKLPATQAVYVDLKQKIVAVQLKDGQKPDTKTMTSEITEAGYDVVKVETSTLSLSQIKAELKTKPKATP